ncbi:MAG: type II toxin-antitoxin system VapC family toxin [Planctomycetota bacterium]
MTAAIVDASVGVKCFLPEVDAAEAHRGRNGPDELHAPAFFFDLEIANILWKKVRRAEITRADADLILAQMPAGTTFGPRSLPATTGRWEDPA